MTIVPIVILTTSLFAIGVLFAIKRWETAHGRVLAPQVRMRADRGALKLKSRLQDVRLDAAKLPPMAALYSRYFVHEAALSFAAFARTAERQAHRVADPDLRASLRGAGVGLQRDQPLSAPSRLSKQ